jgi:hypothetical protein
VLGSQDGEKAWEGRPVWIEHRNSGGEKVEAGNEWNKKINTSNWSGSRLLMKLILLWFFASERDQITQIASVSRHSNQ